MITLAESKIGMATKTEQTVVDEFRRASWLLDSLVFDDAASPGTGGSTFFYNYTQLKTPSTASFRAINNEYTSNEALRGEKTVKLGIFGGDAGVDRAINLTSRIAQTELGFQMEQKIKGGVNLFHNSFINGDRTANVNEFDGLDIMLTGTSTEFGTGATTAVPATMTEAQALTLTGKMWDWFSKMEDTPSFIMGNDVMINRLAIAAMVLKFYRTEKDEFGRKVQYFNDIPLLKAGKYWNGSASVDIIPTDAGGETSLFAAKIGLDGVHGVSPAGDKIIKTYIDDLKTTGVVKKIGIEAIMCIALKNTLKAGVFRRLNVGV